MAHEPHFAAKEPHMGCEPQIEGDQTIIFPTVYAVVCVHNNCRDGSC